MKQGTTVFSHYFGHLAKPTTTKALRLDEAKKDWQNFIQKYWNAANKNHEEYLALDFIAFADNYLSTPQPVSVTELREIAAHFIEQWLDSAEEMRLKNHDLKTKYTEFEPPKTAMRFDADINGLLEVRLTKGQKDKLGLYQRGLASTQKIAEVKEKQASFFLGWLLSPDAHLFFQTYRILRQDVMNNGVTRPALLQKRTASMK